MAILDQCDLWYRNGGYFTVDMEHGAESSEVFGSGLHYSDMARRGLLVCLFPVDQHPPQLSRGESCVI